MGWQLWTRLESRAGLAAAKTSGLGRIRSCIFVFQYGGPSHLDTFDMKPQGPSEVRGEFQPIPTSVPGLHVCEHLPHLARIMHKVAIIRSMHHTNRLHDSASIETFTGRQGPNGDREEFAPIAQFFPCHGAVIHALLAARNARAAPLHEIPHVVVPWLFHNVIDVPCQGGGFLGQGFDPFLVEGNPQDVSFRAQMLQPATDVPHARLERRRELLATLDDRSAAQADVVQDWNAHYDRAVRLLESRQLFEVFQIERETEDTRRRYGLMEQHAEGGGNGAEKAHGRNLRGQSLLLARRLVEAGIPFINVNDFRQQGQNWDAHADNFAQHRQHLLPAFDRGLAALIDDLDERGLLDTTLVVAAGEFGRTPTINAQAGRDHWPDCYSLLLAGGGIRGGQVYGSSDRTGAYPETDPVTPADLAATIYSRFGLAPHQEIHDPTGRPWRIADGRPLAALF